MKTTTLSLLAALAMFGVLAAPHVDQHDVTVTQNSSTVKIRYTLTDEPAIITVDIQTNVTGDAWASIGDENIQYLGGAVNKIVRTLDQEQEITWKACKSWPGHDIAGGKVRAVVKAWSTNAPPDYMIVDLTAKNALEFYVSSNAVPGGVLSETYKKDKLVMRRIPASNVRWRMGSPEGEKGSSTTRDDETPHIVELSQDYYMGIFPITQAQITRLTGSNYSNFYNLEDSPIRPCEKYSYESIRGDDPIDDAKPIKKLRDHSGIDSFDLPTDAQWEFACRAGKGSGFNDGNDIPYDDWSYVPTLDNIAWTSRNANGETHPVGLKAPNDWGLYDCHGNVREWCKDRYGVMSSQVVEGEIHRDPTGPATGDSRVWRGGCFIDSPYVTRSAFRGGQKYNDGNLYFGFRVMCGTTVK